MSLREEAGIEARAYLECLKDVRYIYDYEITEVRDDGVVSWIVKIPGPIRRIYLTKAVVG